MLLELVWRAEQLGMPLDEREASVLEHLVGTWLHVILNQLRLILEEVLLRRRSRHVQVDDMLGLRRELRGARRERVVGGLDLGHRAQERRKGERAQSRL